MQPFVENYQKRSLEFYDLHLFSIIHILYIQYLLTEFTNKITNLSDVPYVITSYNVMDSNSLGAIQRNSNSNVIIQYAEITINGVIFTYVAGTIEPLAALSRNLRQVLAEENINLLYPIKKSFGVTCEDFRIVSP